MATTIFDMSRKAVQMRHCFVAKKRHTINTMIYSDIFNRKGSLKAGFPPLAWWRFASCGLHSRI
jgi:hypothetical protein